MGFSFFILSPDLLTHGEALIPSRHRQPGFRPSRETYHGPSSIFEDRGGGN